MVNAFFDVSSAAPDRFAAPEFFYRNLHIQETLTTIKYGIETRKGLTALTGPAGVGKSLVLRKAADEAAANVTCVLQTDPRTTFADILRVLLRNFGCEQSEGEEAAMLRTCVLQLRSRLEQCQLVALFLDNAHEIPDETIRLVTQNFLMGSAEDPDGTLLQVVLAGRPELRKKLSRAALTSVRRRNPVLCELQPLNSGEVGSFIKKALKTVGKPVETFDERAIKRVALYGNGNPGAIRSICARALLLAEDSEDGAVTTEAIDSAASELNLTGLDDASEWSEECDFDEPRPFATVKDNDHHFTDHHFHEIGFALSDAPDEPSISRFSPRDKERDNPQANAGSRTANWLRPVLILAVVAALSALVGKDAAVDIAANWSAALTRIAMPYLTLAPSDPPETQSVPEKTSAQAPLVPLPGPDRPAAVHADSASFVSQDTDSAPPRSGAPTAEHGVRLTRSTRQASAERAPALKTRSTENLQDQIARAIENRAIMGVEVSVVQGTAILDGRVASERQRRAAERAARSVAGVERVRNRIAITLG